MRITPHSHGGRGSRGSPVHILLDAQNNLEKKNYFYVSGHGKKTTTSSNAVVPHLFCFYSKGLKIVSASKKKPQAKRYIISDVSGNGPSGHNNSHYLKRCLLYIYVQGHGGVIDECIELLLLLLLTVLVHHCQCSRTSTGSFLPAASSMDSLCEPPSVQVGNH